ncbi:MAG: enoyl-CoA hydratase/isomerase family protein [Acidobacteria bacterium]|nr:enoyl-CoA hydratase/isomerase family protein [Acidobacteriota bacterium]
MSNFLSIETHEKTFVVRFVRPELKNPLSQEVLNSLHLIVDDLAVNAEVEKVVFTGSGGTFASGANLNEISSLAAENAADFAKLGQSLMKKIDELPQLVVAAINGHCFGGALDLALSCDVRMASPDAQFAHPGASLGIITGWGGTQRLPRLIGQERALEMFFTATPISALTAENIGLIDKVAEDVLAASFELVR